MKRRKASFLYFLLAIIILSSLSLIFPFQIFSQGASCTSNNDCPPGQLCMSGTGMCVGPGGSSFTGDTKIATPSGEKEIKDLKEGDVVKSFNPETGEIKESTVSAVHKREVSEYYILKTESGREIKVTGEHPILAVKASKSEAPNPKSETPLRQGFVRGAANSKLKILNSKLRDFFEKTWSKIQDLVL